MSLQGTDIFGSPSRFVALSNYVNIFSDQASRQTLVRTLIFTASIILGRLIIGLAIAVLLTRNIRGNSAFRALLTSPISVSVSAASLGFAGILSPAGIINSALQRLGLSPIPWFTTTKWAFPSIIFVTIWSGLAFTLILFCAALENVDPSVIEAARVDGAHEVRILAAVVFPLISPTTFFIAITSGIEALTSFAQIHILTRGGPANSSTTIVYDIYMTAFSAGSANFGVASALGILLFMLVSILTIAQFRIGEKSVNY